jgi:hypothetical protein
LLDQPALGRRMQPAQAIVRNEVIRSMELNMFATLVGVLPNLDLDGIVELRTLLLMLARQSGLEHVDH